MLARAEIMVLEVMLGALVKIPVALHWPLERKVLPFHGHVATQSGGVVP